ncbi:Uncharacterised protein [Shigella dysenteriae]|nr:Uncharacterised protein [Shigella dysenteriae]
MTINALKEKLKLTCGAIFIFFIHNFCFFFGCYATYELFLWNDIIVYSWGYILIIFLPFTLYVMSFEILFFSISGRRLSKVTMVRLWLIIKIIIAFSICAMLIFSSIYKKELLSRNYIACNGIRLGGCRVWQRNTLKKNHYVKETAINKPIKK